MFLMIYIHASDGVDIHEDRFPTPKCVDIDGFGTGWVPIHALYHHRIAMQNTYGGDLRKYYALAAYLGIYTIYIIYAYILVI